MKTSERLLKKLKEQFGDRIEFGDKIELHRVRGYRDSFKWDSINGIRIYSYDTMTDCIKKKIGIEWRDGYWQEIRGFEVYVLPDSEQGDDTKKPKD